MERENKLDAEFGEDKENGREVITNGRSEENEENFGAETESEEEKQDEMGFEKDEVDKVLVDPPEETKDGHDDDKSQEEIEKEDAGKSVLVLKGPSITVRDESLDVLSKDNFTPEEIGIKNTNKCLKRSINDSQVLSDTDQGETGVATDDESKPIEVRHQHVVKRSDSMWYPAEFIRRRPLPEERHCPSSNGIFVRYIGLNSLSPEWVQPSQVSHLKKFEYWYYTMDPYPLISHIIIHKNSSESCCEIENGMSANSLSEKPNQEDNTETHLEVTSQMDAMAIGVKREYDDLPLNPNAPVTKIDKIVLGKNEIQIWYDSPYPEPYGNASLLYICPYCLMYADTESSYKEHCTECEHHEPQPPPSSLLYENDGVSIWEIDGATQEAYCVRLRLLGKLFLDYTVDKLVFLDVKPFMFYVLCEVDSSGKHKIVGYFSKEKNSSFGFNVYNIVIFPPYQKKGYGTLLVSFSYKLSFEDDEIGSPKTPLSQLGKRLYDSYWRRTLLDFLQNFTRTLPLTIEEISLQTSITPQHICSTLTSFNNMRNYWQTGRLVHLSAKMIEDYAKHNTTAPKLILNEDRINWNLCYVNQPKTITENNHLSSKIF